MPEIIPFSILYFLGYYLSISGHAVLSACLLLICGLVLYLFYVRRYGNPLVPVGIFSMSWIFCIGLACLKLSKLQSVWSFRTWLTFYLIYVSFVFCFRFRENQKKWNFIPDLLSKSTVKAQQLYPVIIIFTCISLISFIMEAVICGYIPLFTEGTPHAYSYFHVSGLHYFTVLCVLIPSLCILYLDECGKNKNFVPIILCCSTGILLPILLVSRFQLVFSVLLAFLTLILVKRLEWKDLLRPRFIFPGAGSLVLLIALYVFITVERAHSIEYLNGIFEMKNEKMPIFITQPYIYIVNNFENFDCLVRNIEQHTNGLRMLYPVFALTGIKFLKPELVSFPLYLTKEELTTVTMFYDAYYDFGIIGCVLFSALLGFCYRILYWGIRKNKQPFYVLVFAQLTLYLILAFFTTWFSNPTTWFYIGACIVTDLILWYTSNRKLKHNHNV